MIDERAAAKILGYGSDSLKKWRVVGKGPVYYKFHGRVFYKRDDVLRFLSTQGIVRIDPSAKGKVQSIDKRGARA